MYIYTFVFMAAGVQLEAVPADVARHGRRLPSAPCTICFCCLLKLCFMCRIISYHSSKQNDQQVLRSIAEIREGDNNHNNNNQKVPSDVAGHGRRLSSAPWTIYRFLIMLCDVLRLLLLFSLLIVFAIRWCIHTFIDICDVARRGRRLRVLRAHRPELLDVHVCKYVCNYVCVYVTYIYI